MEEKMHKNKYICSECKYRFSRNSDVLVRLCPYCGKSGCIQADKGDTADKIIQEVSRMRSRDDGE